MLVFAAIALLTFQLAASIPVMKPVSVKANEEINAKPTPKMYFFNPTTPYSDYLSSYGISAGQYSPYTSSSFNYNPFQALQTSPFAPVANQYYNPFQALQASSLDSIANQYFNPYDQFQQTQFPSYTGLQQNDQIYADVLNKLVGKDQTLDAPKRFTVILPVFIPYKVDPSESGSSEDETSTTASSTTSTPITTTAIPTTVAPLKTAANPTTQKNGITDTTKQTTTIAPTSTESTTESTTDIIKVTSKTVPDII